MAQGYDYGSGYQYGVPLPASELTDKPSSVYVAGVSFSQEGSTVTVAVTMGDGSVNTHSFDTGSEEAVTAVTLTSEGSEHTLTTTAANGTKTEVGTIDTEDANALTGVTLTNENGVYTVTTTTAGGVTTEVGTIEIPESETGIVEVKDSVVENNTDGYDFHTFTETEDGGTENEIGKFYLAQRQLLSINNVEQTTLQRVGFKYVTQKGVVSSTSRAGYLSAPSIAAHTLAQYEGAIPDGAQGMIVNTGTAIFSSGSKWVFCPITAEALVGLMTHDTITTVQGNTPALAGIGSGGIRVILPMLGGLSQAFNSSYVETNPLTGYVLLTVTSGSTTDQYKISGTAYFNGSNMGSRTLDWAFI